MPQVPLGQPAPAPFILFIHKVVLFAVRPFRTSPQTRSASNRSSESIQAHLGRTAETSAPTARYQALNRAWSATTRQAQVVIDKLAQPAQSRPPASRSRHACAGARNVIRETANHWPWQRGPGPSLSSTRLLWSKLKWKTCASIASSEAAAFRPRASPRFGQALSIAGIVDRRPVTDWCNRVTALPSLRCSECAAAQRRHDKHRRNRRRQ